LKGARVLGCTKHFPGLGEASLDTHQELPTVRKPWSRMWAEDLLPYRKLVRESPFVMVAHANYTAVCDSVPASLSKKWISGVLREKLKYRGLVVCDDLEMGGVLAAAPPAKAAVRHIRAGGDLCLVCHQEAFVRSAFEGLHTAAAKDRRFQTLAQQRVRRVLAYKARSAAVAGRYPKPSSTKIAQLSRALWEFAEQVRYSSEQPEEEA
ncbi:MAG: glycoside hydrolase family 3 protein, partial [Acidobacteriales bacterium]|nr:glycoside hydrolase family 3 protein [Terriglobales bacterium]